MKIKKEFIFLVLLFLFTLFFRLHYTLSFNEFSSDTAYFHLTNIENLVQDKEILSYNPLSYGGRFLVYSWVFHVIFAILTLGSKFLLKAIPEVFLSTLVFFVYLIAYEITKDKLSSFFSALLSAFIPIFLTETMNVISVYSLILPLLFLSFYLILKLNSSKYCYILIITVFLLSFIHPSSFIFVLTLIFYFFLMSGGALSSTRLEKEAALFSVLLMILVQFVIYKNLFLDKGLDIVWTNVPFTVLSDFFKQPTVFDFVLGFGVLPYIFGLLGLYLGLVKYKTKGAYLFGAFSLVILSLLALRFISINLGLMFLGLALSVVASIGIKSIFGYISNLRLSHFKPIFVLIFLILFVSLSFVPSVLAVKNLKDISEYKINDLYYLRGHSQIGSVVLGNIYEGHIISYFATRKNVADTNFLNAPNPVKRLGDIDQIYSQWSTALALELIRANSIDIIYLSNDTLDRYNITDLKYVNDECFVKDGRFYFVTC